MKVVFITVHVAFIYLLKYWEPTRETYRREQDEFGHWNKVAAPSFCLGFVVHLMGSGFSDFNLVELFWTFSIVLESFALLPQILMYRQYRQVENLTGGAYILLMGAYRFLYGINWIYRANYEPHYKHHWVVYFFGMVQVVVAAWGFFWPSASTEDSAPLGPQLKEFCSSLFAFGNFSTPELESPTQEYALVEDRGDEITDAPSKGNEQLACESEKHDGEEKDDDPSSDEDPLSKPLLVV